MTSLERVLAAALFQRPDRIPAIPQIFGLAARLAGVPLGQYLTDAAVLARCQVSALRRFGSDAVFALLDVNVETEALGSRLRCPSDSYPSVERYALRRASEVGGLRVPDPKSAGRMPVAVEAARLLRREVGDDVLVAGCVLGPATLACQLLGPEEALFAAADTPADFARVLDFGVEIALRFGEAQLEAGAHLCVIFDPWASPAVLPPALFRERVAPRLHRLVGGLRARGAIASWLHVAGPTDRILPEYGRIGVDLANLDYCVEAGRARADLPRQCFDGNVRPMAFVDSEPDAVAAACAPLVRLGRDGGFILSSGCEIPLEARPECVAALVDASRASPC